MIGRVVVGLALGVGIAGAGTALPARAQDAGQTPGVERGAEAVQTQAAVQAPDLTGLWRFDAKRSDRMASPAGAGGMRGPHGGMGGGMGGPMGGGMGGGVGGGMGGPVRGGMGGPVGGGRGGPGDSGVRPVQLPDLMHVTQTPRVVSFEDSSGAVLREVTTLGGAQDTLAHAPRAQVLSGVWAGEKLVVQREGPLGGKVTETVSLEDKGTLLVIRTKIESSGDLPAREFKRAYRRVTD